MRFTTLTTMRRIAARIVSMTALLSSITFAWRGGGHQLDCLTAEDRLTWAAKAEIHDLPQKNVSISDAHIASWADQIRREPHPPTLLKL